MADPIWLRRWKRKKMFIKQIDRELKLQARPYEKSFNLQPH